MKKLIFLLLAVMMLTACGQDKENNQGAVYVNITAEESKKIISHISFSFLRWLFPDGSNTGQ